MNITVAMLPTLTFDTSQLGTFAGPLFMVHRTRITQPIRRCFPWLPAKHIPDSLCPHRFWDATLFPYQRERGCGLSEPQLPWRGALATLRDHKVSCNLCSHDPLVGGGVMRCFCPLNKNVEVTLSRGIIPGVACRFLVGFRRGVRQSYSPATTPADHPKGCAVVPLNLSPRFGRQS